MLKKEKKKERKKGEKKGKWHRIVLRDIQQGKGGFVLRSNYEPVGCLD